MPDHVGASESPFAKLSRTPDKAVRWTSGFWNDRQKLVRNQTIDSMLSALADPKNATYFGNFKAVATGSDGFHGRFWSDGDCYKTVEAMLILLDLEFDTALAQQIDAMVDDILGAQEPDGYINTQITLTDLGRWTHVDHHELYNLGHFFTLACLHNQVTGSDRLLGGAIRAADNLYETFISREPHLAKFDFNPSQIMGLVELYRESGESKFLQLARLFVENRGAHPGLPGNNGDQSQMRIPLLEERDAVGHAVSGPYLWAGAADIFMETNEPALFEAVERIWADSTQRRMYITGGIGSLHKGTSERSSPRFEQIAECYGRPYQLPNDSAYNETCANLANAMWSWRMLQITGDARYADVMEQVMYNAGLSGMSLSGRAFTYTNPLKFNGADHQLLHNDSARRWERFGCYCCPPQVARTIAGIHRWAYSQGQSALWVHLYGSSTVEFGAGSKRFALEQTTNFPWDGTITLKVVAAPEGEFDLNIRIPGWSRQTALTINGRDAVLAHAGPHYHSVRKHWSIDDTVVLDVDMAPRIVVGRPEIEEVRNQGAVMRGPMVYCLEAEDLPEDTALDDIVLSPSAAFSPATGEGPLEGLGIIGVDLHRRAPWTADAPYSDLNSADLEPVAANLIPYFAWNNRPDNRMTVWLPLRDPKPTALSN